MNSPSEQGQTVATLHADAGMERARKKREAVKPNRDWRKVVGLLGDSPFEREAWALGEAWRKAQREP